MYICMCNPFTDHDLQNFLESTPQKLRVKDAYKACSGGEDMNCGTCACTVKQMVDCHNQNLTIRDISNKMEKAVQKTKQTV